MQKRAGQILVTYFLDWPATLSILSCHIQIKHNAAPLTTDEENQELVQDLERRIDTLQELDDAEFGSFTRTDYVLLIIFALVLPTIALVLAA